MEEEGKILAVEIAILLSHILYLFAADEHVV